MLKKIVKFIRYNALVTVVIIIAFVAVASAVADEDTRNKVIGEEVVEKSGVDNSVLLATDLDNFDLAMKIVGALEDEENYYINYQYKTLAIKNNVWQEVLYEKQMTVSKESLDGRDLGLYVMEELGEIIDYQLAYLKEVQENEVDKGETRITEVKEYTGLIGLVLDTETKELPGYEPVVKPVVAEVVEAVEEEPPLTLPWRGGEDQDYPEESAYQEWVEENVDEEEEEGSLGDWEDEEEIGEEEKIVSEEEDDDESDLEEEKENQKELTQVDDEFSEQLEDPEE